MNLFKIENSIENSELIEFDKLTKLLKLKINFLKYKWKARKQQENPSSIYYFRDGNIEMIQEEISDNAKLKEWIAIIESHYELYTNWKSEIQSRVRYYKDKPLKDLSFLEIHQLIKYFKDVRKNDSKLKEISTFLLSKKDDSLFFNAYCCNIFSDYCLNNKFSSFLEKASSIPAIKEEYNLVKDKVRGDVNNFFLEFKYLNTVVDILLKKIEDDKTVDFITNYEKTANDECKIILENYFKNKEWAKRNFNYIFQLPYLESLVEIDRVDDLNNIFIASSFTLPPVNNNIEKHYSGIKQKLTSVSLHIEVVKRLRKDLEKIEELNKAFDRRDFKSIEIISIFTAIITFVLSSIPAYKFVNSVWDSLLFMLTLSSALGIFVMLILFSTRGFRNNSRGVIYVTTLAILAIFGYNCLIGFEKKKIIIDEKEKAVIDSIIKLKADSIIKIHPIKKMR